MSIQAVTALQLKRAFVFPDPTLSLDFHPFIPTTFPIFFHLFDGFVAGLGFFLLFMP